MADSIFHIRNAEVARQDAQFILAAFDSALPHLNATGSGAQWGSEPISQNASLTESVTKCVEEAETARRNGEASPADALVAEVDVEDGRFEHVEKGERMRVAGILVKPAWWPAYITNEEHLAAITKDETNWAYVYVLISDFRTGEFRKGAGAALIKQVKENAKARGVERLYVDCWAGNGRKLVKFYEKQGFVCVGDFLAERPHKKDLGPFEGAFFKMDL